MFKSLKLWSFYVDLEESLGTVETAKAVYDKILDLRIANAQIIVNYAAFLEENKYYEESFKVNMKSASGHIFVLTDMLGIRAWYGAVHIPRLVRNLEHLPRKVHQAICELLCFHQPTNSTKLPIQGGSKIERARDLFEQALEKCPPKHCKPIFLMYATYEEEHGLAKRAMSIYDRATGAVADEDKFEVRFSPSVSMLNEC